MIKIYMVLLFLTIQITANESFTVKTKIKFKEQFTKVVFLLKSDISEHISHIEASVDGNLIYNIYTTQNLSRHSLFRFKFKNPNNSENLKFIFTNSKKLQRKYEFTNKQVVNMGVDKTKNKINAKVFNATSVQSAIQKYYGVEKTQEGNFTIVAHDWPQNSTSVPIRIKSNLDLESIMILSDGATNPVFSIFTINNHAFIDYEVNYRFRKDGNWKIIVVGKGKNGKLYKSTKKIEIAPPPTCSGD